MADKELITVEANIENFKKLLDCVPPILRFSHGPMASEGYDNLCFYPDHINAVIVVKLVIKKD